MPVYTEQLVSSTYVLGEHLTEFEHGVRVALDNHSFAANHARSV